MGSMGQVGLKPGWVNDFPPFWNVGRALFNKIDPYGQQVTLQNQIAAYGAPATVVGIAGDQVFPYPLPAAIMFLPFAFLPLPTANKIVFVIFLGCIAATIGWMRDRWDGNTLLYAIIALSSYPVICALEMHQPSILFYSFAVAGLAALRRGNLITAGVISALSLWKPQIAIATLLPIAIWTISSWRERKRLAASFLSTTAALLMLTTLLQPTWIVGWIAALRSYSSYVYPSVVILAAGKRMGFFISILLFISVCVLVWLDRKEDLWFQSSIVAVIIHLITPYGHVQRNSIVNTSGLDFRQCKLYTEPWYWGTDRTRSISNGFAWTVVGAASRNSITAVNWVCPKVRMGYAGRHSASPVIVGGCGSSRTRHFCDFSRGCSSDCYSRKRRKNSWLKARAHYEG